MRIAVRFSVILFAIVAAAVAVKAAPQYVQVKTPLAPVYKYLEPQSPIITQAKRGEHFELVYPGVSWYQVKVKGEVGWLERRAGEIVNSTNSVSLPTIAIFLVLLVGTFIGVFMFIQRQKTTESLDI